MGIFHVHFSRFSLFVLPNIPKSGEEIWGRVKTRSEVLEITLKSSKKKKTITNRDREIEIERHVKTARENRRHHHHHLIEYIHVYTYTPQPRGIITIS